MLDKKAFHGDIARDFRSPSSHRLLQTGRQPQLLPQHVSIELFFLARRTGLVLRTVQKQLSGHVRHMLEDQFCLSAFYSAVGSM